MSVKEDRVNLVITINGDAAKKELNELDKKAYDLRQQTKELQAQHIKYTGAVSELSKVNHLWTEADKLVLKLRDEMKGLTVGTQAYKDKTRELSEAEQRFNRLDTRLQKLKEETESLKEASQKYVASTKELQQVEVRMAELRNKIGLTGLTTKQLNDELRKLTMIRANLTPGTQAFIENEASIRKVKTRLGELNYGIKVTGGIWNKMKDEFRQFGILAASFFGIQFFASQIQNVISKAGKLEDQLADIRQTTGFTTEEVKKLNAELGKIDTRTSTSELRDIAKVAGQFGVAKEDILDFTRAVNQSAVVLKSEFSGGTEEIATKLAGLRNVFQDIKSDKIDQDLMRIGNAEIVLAQQGIATAPIITDFSNRIGGVGIQLGLTSGQVLGMSATLQELNVNVERGGTAVSRILQKMSTDTAQFAKVAGVPLKEFEHEVNTNIYGAFLKFVDGTKRGGESATQFAAILKDSELAGAGAGEVISKLAGNQVLLKEKVEVASEALKSTTAITEQYAIKNETLGAKLDRLGKDFYKLATSEGVTNFLKKAVDMTAGFIKMLQNLPEWLNRNAIMITTMTGATLLYYTSVLKATGAVLFNTVAETAKNAAYQIGYRWLLLKEAAIKAYAMAKGVLTGQITLATAAQRIWNAVILANPIGALVLALTALVVGIQLYVKNTREAIALERDKKNLQKELVTLNDDLKRSYESFATQIEKTNKLSVQERADLLDKIRLKKEEAKATLEQMKVQQESIRLRSSEATVWQKAINLIKNYGNVANAAFESANDGMQNGLEAGAKYQDGIDQTAQGVKELSEEEQKLFEIQNAENIAMNMAVETTENYDEKLRLLRLALNNAALGSADYLRISNEIRDTQREFDLIKGAGGNTDEEIKKLNAFKEKTQELFRKLQDIKLTLIEDEHERETESLRLKLSRDKEEIEKNIREGLVDKDVANQLLLALDEKYEKDHKDLVEKYNKAIADKEYQDATDNLERWHETEKLALTRQLNNGEITRKEYDDRNAENEKLYLGARLQNQLDYNKSDLEAAQALEDAKLAAKTKSDQDYLNDLVAQKQLEFELAADGSYEELQAHIALVKEKGRIEAEAYEEGSTERKLIEAQTLAEIEALNVAYVQKLAGQFQQAYGQILGIYNSWMNIQSNREQRELQLDKQRNDQKKKNLKKQLDDKVISQDEYNEKINALDEEQHRKEAAAKRREFRRKQEAAKTEAVINGIVSVVKTMSEYAYPYNLIFAALDAAAVAIQIAEIDSQPAPEFGKGGRLPISKAGGLTEGPSHDDGGIDLISTSTGKKVGNVEGGEPILSQATYINNKEVVDKLLHQSLYRNGAPLPEADVRKYETGGFMPMLQALPARDQSNIYRQARYVMDSPDENERLVRTNDLRMMIDRYHEVYREAITLITEHETRATEIKTASYNVEKIRVTNEINNVERQITETDRQLQEENRLYLQHENDLRQSHERKLITEKQYELRTEELYNTHYDRVTEMTDKMESLTQRKQALESTALAGRGQAGEVVIPVPDPKPQRVLTNKPGRDNQTDSSETLFNQQTTTAFPDFLSAQPPSFDIQRILETVNIERNIVNPFTQQQPNMPLQQTANPNSNQDLSLLVTQMIEHLVAVKDSVNKLNDVLENPVPQKNYVTITDVRRAEALVKNAEDGSKLA